MRIACLTSNLLDDQINRMVNLAHALYGVDLRPEHQQKLSGSLKPVRLFATEQCERNQYGNLQFVASGYTTAAKSEKQSILHEALDGVSDMRSLGGIYCAHVTDGVCGISWPSIPASGGLFYASWGGGVLVSNRPRLIAECIGLEPDQNYLDYMIAIGYPLDNTSPFKNVKAIMGHQAIRVENGNFEVLRRTLGGTGYLSKSDQEAESADTNYINELLTAVSAIDNFSNVEFRLSGGKDSRLIAAALYATGRKPVAHTRGAGEDVTVAKKIAEQLDFKLVNTGSSDNEATLLEKTCKVLALSDGLIETEAHVGLATYQPILKGQNAIIFGHSHLQKGGMARTMKYTNRNEAISFLSSNTVPIYIKEPFRDYFNQKVKVILNQFQYSSNLDILFFPYAILRAGRYLEPLWAKIETTMTPVFPLNDEKLYIAASNLNRSRRTRELSMFDAIRKLAPGLELFPLANDKWRFQRPDETLLIKKTVLPEQWVKNEGPKRDALIQQVTKTLKNSPVMERAKLILDDEILVKCGLLEGRSANAFQNFKRNHREKLVMRLWFAHVSRELF